MPDDEIRESFIPESVRKRLDSIAEVEFNTSRGGVIDEAALIEELKKERFTAVLDVYEQEPLPENYPLRNMVNVYAVPHMGGPTYDRRKYVTLALADDIEAFWAGEPVKHEITRSYVSHMTKALSADGLDGVQVDKFIKAVQSGRSDFDCERLVYAVKISCALERAVRENKRIKID